MTRPSGETHKCCGIRYVYKLLQGDLVLLLDQAGGRIWNKYIPAFSVSEEVHSQPLVPVILEAWPSDSSFQSMQIIFFQGKTGRWMLLSVPFGLSLAGDPCEWSCTYYKLLLCLPQSCLSTGQKPHWISELGVLGSCPSGGIRKSSGPKFYGVQILNSLRRIWELGASPLCIWVFSESVIQIFLFFFL